MIKPYNRRELYIAALSDSSLTIPDYPYSREETYLAKINGQSVTIPAAPANRYETYLAKLAGENVTVPTPVSRLEFFLYKACGGDCTIPSPVSREEELWMDYINAIAIDFDTQPEDISVTDGDTATFSVAVSGGTEPYSYQWQVKVRGGSTWADVSSASGKTASFHFTAQTMHNGYQYHCVVTDNSGVSVTSDSAKLTVTSAENPLSITSQPDDVTVVAGETATFRVTVTGGTEPYTYQWQVSKNKGSTWANVASASGKTANFHFTTQNMHNGYQYHCVVTDDAGDTVTSDAAALTVTAE